MTLDRRAPVELERDRLGVNPIRAYRDACQLALASYAKVLLALRGYVPEAA
jgi:asparagine synthetase B (glutamine-hydrolysing)